MNRTIIRNGRESAWLGAGRNMHGSPRVSNIVYRSLPRSRYHARQETLPASYYLLFMVLVLWLAGLSLDLALWLSHAKLLVG